MPAITIRPGPTNEDGFARYRDASWANVIAGIGTGAGFNGGSTLTTGTDLAGATYEGAMAFLRFPLTDPALTGAVITAVSLELTSVSPTVGQTGKILDFDAGVSVTTPDYRTNSQLGTLSVLDTITLPGSATTTTFTLGATAIAAVEAAIGSQMGVTITTADMLAGTVPTTEKRWAFRSSDHGTAGERPALIVTYSSGAYDLAAAPGSLALSGQAAGLAAARRVGLVAAAFALSGQGAAVEAARLLSGAAGLAALSGQGAGVTAARLAALAAGSLALSGQAGGFIKGRRLTLEAGMAALAGQDTAFAAARLLAGNAGTIDLGGMAARLARGVRLSAGDGAFGLTGQPAALIRARALLAAAGVMEIDGQDAALFTARLLALTAAGYDLTGMAAGLASGAAGGAAPGFRTIRARRPARRMIVPLARERGRI